jgi:CubicO group peptidase (beta-lactamase class C family)
MSARTYKFGRRQFLLGTGAALISERVYPSRAATTDWIPLAPDQTGFAPDLGARLDDAVHSGRASNVHGVVVVRAGGLVIERYYDGVDEILGRSRSGPASFGPDTLHDMRSVTKSIVGLLYGIALAHGKVPQLDEPLLAAFPEYADLTVGGRDRLTIAHALTMTLGTDWDEQSRPYADPSNSETMMNRAADRYRFILERAVVAEPGTKWTYNGGAADLLGRLIAKGTGTSLPDFARGALFEPLGIGPTEWVTGRDGVPLAHSGLRMTPRDLARIGQMVLASGAFDGRQVVSPTWLEASFKPAVKIPQYGTDYGYFWYVGEFTFQSPQGSLKERSIGAFGNGGQRLFVFPGLEFAIAITAGNYNRAGQSPGKVLDQVLSSLL